MADFFFMDGYGLYIWLSYLLSFVFILGAALHSWRAARRLSRKAKN